MINLNSFGFIREACRVKQISFRERATDVFGDLEEYDSSILDSFQELDNIAGGSYWQQVIDQYGRGEIDCYEAEKEFSRLYKERLRKNYTYVLDMPIRLKPGHHPKYRMVHATNHPDGCLLMAGNIAKRTDRLVIDIQSSGQMSLLQQTAENEEISEDDLMAKLKESLESTTSYVKLNQFLADFYNRYGVLCDTSRLSSGQGGSALKTLEDTGYIEVLREPSLTKTGRPSKFWQEKRGYTICLRKRS